MERRSINRNALSLATTLAVMCMATSASAQNSGLEEVLVTAQKLEQDLQSVPVAVSAISASELERRSITRLDDIEASVPSLVIHENTGLSNGAAVFVRGVGEDDSRIGADPAVALYIDDQYYGRQMGALMQLVEIERVEVLRGPQGTLYGRNSNGGAIKIYSRRPGEETEISADATFGNENLMSGKFRVAGPLTDNLLGQLAIGTRQRDGFYEGPGIDDELGEVDQNFALAGLTWLAGDWAFDLKLDYTDDQSDPNISNTAGEGWRLSGPLLFPSSEIILGMPGLWDNLTQDDVYADTEIFGTSLAINGRVGEMDFKSITGYRSTEGDLVTRLGFYYEQDVEYTSFSQEFQLSQVDGEGFDWLGGLYYYEENAEQYTQFFFALSDMDIDTESVAVFGQLYYNFGNDTRLTLGGRYTDEEKELDGTALDFSFTPLANKETESDQNFDYRIALDHHLSDDSMIYGSVTTGSKAFGWSSDNLALVDTEEVTTYELGLRTEFPDQNLRLNITGFFNEYDDLQTNGTLPNGQFSRFNVPEVETMGVELESIWAPIENLRFDATLSWMDGEYNEVNDAFLSATGAGSESEAKNLELKSLPEWSFRLGISYDILLGDNGNLNLAADYAYTDESYTLLSNTPTSLREQTDIFNARIGWVSASDRWTVALWGKNLSDEDYIVAAVSDQIYPAAPRTYGIDLGVRF
jgi:iron complex outermembrane recepter protein